MASEQDAARDRVLAARAEFDQQVEALETSGRAALDIPARIRQSPAKAAAVVGAIGFLIVGGPGRLIRAVRRRLFGEPAPMPKRMLPKDIEKTLRSMGDDGDKVRGTLERDFAQYAKKADKDRKGLLSVALLALARPLLARGAKSAVEFLVSPSPEGEGRPTRLDELRAQAATKVEQARSSAERAGTSAREQVDKAGDTAKERLDRARAKGPGDAEDESPTGI